MLKVILFLVEILSSCTEINQNTSLRQGGGQIRENVIEKVDQSYNLLGDGLILLVLTFSVGGLFNFLEDVPENSYKRKISNFLLSLGFSLVILLVKRILIN